MHFRLRRTLVLANARLLLPASRMVPEVPAEDIPEAAAAAVVTILGTTVRDKTSPTVPEAVEVSEAGSSSQIRASEGTSRSQWSSQSRPSWMTGRSPGRSCPMEPRTRTRPASTSPRIPTASTTIGGPRSRWKMRSLAFTRWRRSPKDRTSTAHRSITSKATKFCVILGNFSRLCRPISGTRTLTSALTTSRWSLWLPAAAPRGCSSV